MGKKCYRLFALNISISLVLPNPLTSDRSLLDVEFIPSGKTPKVFLVQLGVQDEGQG